MFPRPFHNQKQAWGILHLYVSYSFVYQVHRATSIERLIPPMGIEAHRILVAVFARSVHLLPIMELLPPVLPSKFARNAATITGSKILRVVSVSTTHLKHNFNRGYALRTYPQSHVE